MDLTTCPHCGVRVIPKSDDTCPSCTRNLGDVPRGRLADTESANAAPPSAEAPEVISNIRGCGFGCLYMIVSWIAVGIFASLSIPAVFPEPPWNQEAIGSLTSRVSVFVVCIPLGIYVFLRHRRRRTRGADYG